MRFLLLEVQIEDDHMLEEDPESLGYALLEETSIDFNFSLQRATWGDSEPPDDEAAFDGSFLPQRRPLTARERDVLCRILSDVMQPLRRPDLGIEPLGRTGDPSELPMLRSIYQAIDPRND